MADGAVGAIAQALELMREGKVQDADDLLVKAQEDAAAAAATAGAPKPKPPPRQPEQVIIDLFTKLADLHGNHPVITGLIDELAGLVIKPVAAAKAK